MNVEYRYWEPNKGYEKYQVDLYKVTNPQARVTAEDVVTRYANEKIDPKTVRYAFNEKNEMIAYCQARDYPEPKQTHIGPAHAIKDCPEEVREKLFNELLVYLKEREEINTLELRANVGADNKEYIEFLKKKGFVVKEENFRYELNIKKIYEVNHADPKFTVKHGSEKDIPDLVALIKEDGRFSGQFNTDEDITNYFKRVFEIGHVIMIFVEDKLVMGTAPLLFKLGNDDKESLILRFHSFLKGYEDAYKLLLVEYARECVKANYGLDSSLAIFPGRNDTEFVRVLDEFKANKIPAGLSFGLD